jgi:hypothetical protein
MQAIPAAQKEMGEKVECNMLVLGDEANLVIL